MKYICIFVYSGKSINCKNVVIPYGSEMSDDDNYIFDSYNNEICRIDSQVGHLHFAFNDDGNGLERGAITRKIIFDIRFTQEQTEIIRENYSDFVKDNPFGELMFNNDFYKADIEILRGMAKDLGISYEVPEVQVEEIKPVEFTVATLKSAKKLFSSNDVDTINAATDTFSAEITTFSDTTTYTTANVVSFDSDVALKEISDSLDTLIAASEVR